MYFVTIYTFSCWVFSVFIYCDWIKIVALYIEIWRGEIWIFFVFVWWRFKERFIDRACFCMHMFALKSHRYMNATRRMSFFSFSFSLPPHFLLCPPKNKRIFVAYLSVNRHRQSSTIVIEYSTYYSMRFFCAT